MSTTDAPTPTALLAVSVASKFPARDGTPEMTPLVVLKLRPGGRPVAVKPSGVFAPVTVKVKGWPRNAIALNGLVTAAGAFEPPVPAVLVGYKQVLGMISSDWLGLYQFKWTCVAPPFARYSS